MRRESDETTGVRSCAMARRLFRFDPDPLVNLERLSLAVDMHTTNQILKISTVHFYRTSSALILERAADLNATGGLKARVDRLMGKTKQNKPNPTVLRGERLGREFRRMAELLAMPCIFESLHHQGCNRDRDLGTRCATLNKGRARC